MASLLPNYNYHRRVGQSLIELLIAMALAAILLPALMAGLVLSRQGRPQTTQRAAAAGLLREAEESVRSLRAKGWSFVSPDPQFYTYISGSDWASASGSEIINGYTRVISITDVQRDSTGKIVASGGTIDPSTRFVTATVSWSTPYPSSVSTSFYLTRYRDNLSYSQSSAADFNTGLLSNVAVTNVTGGELQLAENIKAKWCSPALSPSTIDLPDGPPVAVDAKSSTVSTSIPNDVFVATSPLTSSTIKLAHVNVSANTDPPVSSLRGVFTLNAGSYSNPSYFPTGINLDNDFKTNDVKYYTTSADSNTGFVNPSANSADSGGDGNGYQTNPTRAYTNDASFAVDTNSGSGTSTGCAGSDKDRHRFFNYGLTIPGGVAVSGVEVRLDAKVDSTSGSPKTCAELSWNGGTTWTAVKSTSTLTTGEVTYTLGGSADTWGHAWSSAELTNTNFRLRLTNVAGNTNRDFSLDWAAVKVYYSSAVTKTYALLAANKPDKEMIAVLVNDGDPANDNTTSGEYADPVNKIYKYWTFFNTRIYDGVTPSANDQAPFNYGATTLTVLNDRGYLASGGYLYVFDLSNIGNKSPGSELDQIGCRIQLDGYDCQPGSPASDKKYTAGQTGTSWGDVGSPAHNDCSDGGNIELYATNDVYGVQSGGHNYIYIAVGAGTNPEFDLVDATNVPDGGSGPAISSSSCGRISGGNAGWKLVGTYDFNSSGGSEEAANSVYAKSDGTRAYISSNGTSDSKQFYILNTTNKSSPAFLSGSPSTGPASGYYQGTGANGEMYPRRSLTVLNGQRVVLVGKDGITNSNDAQEYQVLNSETEASPGYCGGINFDQGFNDLTSVSEADGDNFVYMVANTTLNELKIIQGGPDGTYSAGGNYESATFNPGYQTAFNRLLGTITQPGNTTARAQVSVASADSDNTCTNAVFDYIGPDGTAGTFFNSVAASISAAIPYGDHLANYHNPGHCFRYKIYLDTTDYNITPVLYDFSVNYSP